MGIRGLSSFLQQNPRLFQLFELHDTKVIIDGDNLCHHLYQCSKMDVLYGGDYEQFSHVIEDYFSCFIQCKISPLVIFDGAIDISLRKLQTIRNRVIERLKKNVKLSKGYPSASVLPVLALHVFKSVLKELKIVHIQTTYEADDFIAALAKHYKCPVLSMDSDFYLYDIPGGYIPLDSINLKLFKGKGYVYLKCDIYYVSRFLAYFSGVTFEVFPIFSVLIGNDYFNNVNFESFFKNISGSKKLELKASWNHKHIVTVLQWLRCSSLKDAMQHVKKYLNPSDQERLESVVKSMSEEYKNCLVDIKKNVNSGTPAYIPNSPVLPGLPKGFMKAFHLCQLSSFIGNVLVHRKVYLKSSVEDLNQPSANTCSLPFRKAMYNILLNGTNCVEEEDRKETSLFVTTVECELEPGFSNLLVVRDTNLEEKLNFLLEIFSCEIEHLKEFPKNWQILIACLQFIAKVANPPVTEEFITSVLLSCVLFSLNNSPDVLVQFKRFNVRYADIKKAKNITTRFFQTQYEHAQEFTCRIVHCYSQLQSCLYFATHLNRLLLNPLPETRIHEFCNGSFIHAMTSNLENQNNLEMYLSELLEPDSGLDLLYKHFKKILMQFLPSSVLKVMPKRKVKRKKNTRAKPVPSKRDTNMYNALLLDDCG